MFTPSACEGTSNLFELDYFEDQKAYLTQSGQLYAEASAMAPMTGLNKAIHSPATAWP